MLAACGADERPDGLSTTADVGSSGGAVDSLGELGDDGNVSGAPVSTTADPDAPRECGTLQAIVRDFRADHPDFETFMGQGASTGLVLPMIEPRGVPVYNPEYRGQPMITSAETFSQWYQDIPSVNEAFTVDLTLLENPGGGSVFDSSAFFPLDGRGFGNEGQMHNYHFTTEVRTSFTYLGGERFTFRGDDDLWLFVDGRLALDIGGLHEAVEGTVDMDQLGLEVGRTYNMDIFHAERHTVESNFRITTNIACFIPVPVG